MTTPLEQAFPLNANWVAGVVRSKLAEQSIFCTTQTDLSAENFTIQPYAAIAVFGGEGDLEFYAYDAADTTTADDGGLSSIVVSGRRYKKRGEAIVRDAALSATTSEQPATPSLGDTYIVPSAPSGDDWASHADEIATFTARGWIFRQPFIGMIVYAADEDLLYHFDSNGDWIAGLPVGALAAGSVQPTMLAEPFAILKVDSVLNAPPGGSPTTGTMYQVGTSPTGAFAGQANAVARWTGSAYAFLTPAEGDTIYRKDMATLFTFRSGTWGQTVGNPSIVQTYYARATVATTSNAATSRVSTPSITALVGQKIRATLFIEAASINTSSNASTPIFDIGLRIDTSSVLAGVAMFIQKTDTGAQNQSFTQLVPSFVEIDVPDTAAHVYSVASILRSGSANGLSNVTARAIFEVVNPS
jgi:hypothetical protein